MPDFVLPVRFYADASVSQELRLKTEDTALVLVDCDGDAYPEVKGTAIAQALFAARRAGIRVLYFHEDAYGIAGPSDITRQLIGGRLGRDLLPTVVQQPHCLSRRVEYLPVVAPAPEEPDFPKDSQDGFATTNADYCLKSWNIGTLIACSFALRSCLFHTCNGARRRNYRVVMLRDGTTPPGESEFADTRTPPSRRRVGCASCSYASSRPRSDTPP